MAKVINTADAPAPIVGRFRLKHGKHREAGVTHERGSSFDSAKDLAAFDPVKFERLDDRGRPVAAVPAQGEATVLGYQAPGGQVSSGFQTTSGSPEGPVSGLVGAPEIHAKPAVEPQGPRNQQHTKPDLDSMTVEELRALADRENIELRNARSKDEVVNQIRSGERRRAK